MTKTIKKTLALILSILMLMSVVPMNIAMADVDGVFVFNSLDETTAEVIGYKGDSAEVVIPDKVKAYTVVYVRSAGSFTFSNNTNITSVVIPDTVTKIGNGAFAGCLNLKTITIGAGVVEIQQKAFNGCNAVETVNYAGSPEQWNAINWGTFNNSVRYCENIVYYYGHICEEATYTAAVEAGCTTEGKNEFWTCNVCGKIYSDAALTALVTDENTLDVPAIHKNLDKTPATDATCTNTGYYDYWYCEICDTYFADAETKTTFENGSHIIATNDNHSYGEWKYVSNGRHERVCTNNSEHVESFECADTVEDNDCLCDACGELVAHSFSTATCVAGEVCSVCNAKGLDANENNHTLEYKEATDYTCTVNGNYEYWHCTLCNKYFKDKDANIGYAEKEWEKVAQHTLETAGAKKPTCITAGWSEYQYCTVENCTYTTKVEISALGHKFSEIVDEVPATCSVEGRRAYKDCTVCNLHFETNADALEKDGKSYFTAFTLAINPDNHADYEKVTVVTKATCEVAGSKSTSCTKCGKETENIVIPLRGHNLADNGIAVDAKCLEKGIMNQICSNVANDEYDACEYTTTREIPAIGHIFDEIVPAVKATCISGGNDAYKYCKPCNRYFPANAESDSTESKSFASSYNTLIDETNHDFSSEFTIDRNETCTENGLKSRHCLREGCTEVTEETKIPAKHELKKIEATKPTCFNDGNIEYFDCVNCDVNFADEKAEKEIKEKDYTLKYLEHKVFLVPGVVATCTEKGSESYYKCNLCGTLFKDNSLKETIKLEDTVIEEKGHTWSKYFKDGKDGQHYIYCEVKGCGVEKPLSGQAHIWDEGRVITAPTCTETGVKYYYCTAVNCNAKKSEIVPANGHTEVNHKQPATCTDEGREGEKWCTVCEKFTAEAKVIPALGHDWEKLEGHKDATCTEEGKNNLRCKRNGCDATDTAVTDALGHKYEGEYVITAKATCTEAGAQYRPCARDNCKIPDNQVIPATNHKNKIHNNRINPTCVNKGVIEYWECPDCDTNFSDEACTKTAENLEVAIDPDSHQSDKITADEGTPATCFSIGYTYGTKCNDCKKWVSGHNEIPAINHKNKVHHERIAPTCSATGTIEYWACPDCGKKFKDEACTEEVTSFEIAIDSANHVDVTEHNKVDATCLEDGAEAGSYCNDCKTWTGHEIIKANGHKFGTTIKFIATTCLAPGNNAYKQCSTCKLYFTGDAKKDATGGAETTDAFVLPQLSHSYIGTVKSDGNGKNATHSFKCINGCERYGNPTVHTWNWNEGEVTATLSCTVNGVKTYTCTRSNCGATYTEVTTATGHKFGNAVDYKAPTCIAAGNNAYKSCSECNSYFNKDASNFSVDGVADASFFVISVDEDAHTVIKEANMIPANCNEVGYTAGTYCDGCKDFITGHAEISAINHKNKVHHERIAPTCSETGTIEYWHCPDCNADYINEACTEAATSLEIGINSNNHVDTTAHDKVDAKCLTSGTTAGVFCNDCETWISGHSTINALGHTFAEADKVAANNANCLGAGNHAYKKCSTCNLYFAEAAETDAANGLANTSTFVIAMLEHVYTGAIQSDGNGQDATHSFKCINGCDGYGAAVAHIWNSGAVTTAPECLTDGVKTYTCEVAGCGATYTEVIDATNHTFGQITAYTAADCTSAGNEAYKKCENCNLYFAADAAVTAENGVEDDEEFVINALGHDYATTFTVDRKASCTAKGSKSKHCSRCSSTTEKTDIPARTHNYVDTTVQTPATCLGTGVMNQKCDRTETAEYTACTAIDTRIINANGHSFDDVVEAVAATCVATGSVAYKKCTACNKYFAENAAALANNGKDNTDTFATEINHDNHFWSEIKTESTITEKTHYQDCERGCGARQSVGHEISYDKIEVYPTCKQAGVRYEFCAICQTKFYYDIPKTTEHIDNNKDNYCDVCEKIIKEPTVEPTPDTPEVPDEGEPTPECSCNCHKNGIMGLLFDFILFFQRLFGMNKTCDCGVKHY